MAIKTTTPVSEKRNSNPMGCLVLFGLIFFLAGLGGFYTTVLRPIFRVRVAKSWTPVTATITSSNVASHHSDNSTTYSIEVEYSFSFNGRTYYGNTYDFGSGGSSDYSGKQTIVAQLPPGARVTCYVNPANPNQSVIQRNLPAGIWMGLMTLIFVVVGAGIIIGGVVAGRKSQGSYTKTQKWRPKGVPVPYSASANTAQSAMPVADITGGPVTLKPRTTKTATFFVLLIFSVFWNGFIFFFLSQAFHKPGGFEVFLGLFLIPFVLVGLGMIGATIYQFIALFGPKVELTVSQAAVPIGGTLNVNWKLSGRQNVTKFQIYLEGREEATYRRGTDTYTDKNTFCVLDVTDALSSIMQGDGSVQIPANTMHSFEASNNKIVWQLVVKGEIPIWPDIKEEYPIVVLPPNAP